MFGQAACEGIINSMPNPTSVAWPSLAVWGGHLLALWRRTTEAGLFTSSFAREATQPVPPATMAAGMALLHSSSFAAELFRAAAPAYIPRLVEELLRSGVTRFVALHIVAPVSADSVWVNSVGAICQSPGDVVLEVCFYYLFLKLFSWFTSPLLIGCSINQSVLRSCNSRLYFRMLQQ